jgi:hypothetical protein
MATIIMEEAVAEARDTLREYIEQNMYGESVEGWAIANENGRCFGPFNRIEAFNFLLNSIMNGTTPGWFYAVNTRDNPHWFNS